MQIRKYYIFLFISLSLLLSYFLFILIYNLTNFQKNIRISDTDGTKITILEKSFDYKIATLSARQKAGQLLFTSLSSTELTNIEKELLAKAEIGGVVLFAKNIENSEQLIKLTDEIHKQATFSGVKSWISVDQEGGPVSRMDFIEHTAQSEIMNVSQAYDIAYKRGLELKSLGIDVNFSPVVESYVNSDNFIKKQARGFLINNLDLSLAMIRGYVSAGILPVAKHFPTGLSRTFQDPHQLLPNPSQSVDEVIGDVLPFYHLIKRNIPALMITHIIYPSYDNWPTSSSKLFIQNILREEFFYKNLIFTDDLSMVAVVNNYDLKTYAINSISSGTDILIVSNWQEYEKIVNVLEEEIKTNLKFENRVNDSLNRIFSLK